MRMRTGIALIALGRVTSGSLASAAAVPISSVPTKANTAIWKAPTNPWNPLGNRSPPFHRFATLACTPPGEWKPTATMTIPITTKAMIATILMMENQNSISPKAWTVVRFSPSSSATVAVGATHRGRSGHQKLTYSVMAMTSAIAVTNQQT